MLFPLQIVPFLKEMTLFSTNFDYENSLICEAHLRVISEVIHEEVKIHIGFCLFQTSKTMVLQTTSAGSPKFRL